MARTFHAQTAGWLALLAAAAVAACSGGQATSSSGTTSGTTGFGGSSTGGAHAGGSLAAGGDDGGISFFDAAPQPEAGPPPVECDPTCAAAGGTCKAGFCTLVDNPGSVAPATQTALQGGGTGDPTFAWLYPYDKTVFPRGLLPPKLQFAGTAPTSVYVHISFGTLDYKGYFTGVTPSSVTLSAPMWLAITVAAKGTDAVKVDVTKTTGAVVAGPITETWTIAQGSVRGSIYYETYGSALLGGGNSVGIMKILPGATQPTPFKSGCGNVCHTASADGSTLVAATSETASSAYDLKTAGTTIKALTNYEFAYGGLYPDGSFVVSATNYRLWPNTPSRLYDTATGANIPTASWDSVVKNGGTTAFSPDGKFIAFNHEDTGKGHTLALMPYDPTTKAFGTLADIATDATATLAWPAFTPDSKWVLYHAGSNTSFETDKNATGDLYFTDASTHVSARLDALDGYTTAGAATSYLPANDPGLNFAPTVLPEAVGGYFWAVYTSHRSYGNTLPSKDNGDQNGKLWVAAIDLAPTDGKDPSHPGFYLDGQESGADNLRGFWVLNPCQANGTSCQSGDECCGGYCRDAADGGAPSCTATAGGCSMEFDKCTTAADCCNTTDLCINGFCAASAPQ